MRNATFSIYVLWYNNINIDNIMSTYQYETIVTYSPIWIVLTNGHHDYRWEYGSLVRKEWIGVHPIHSTYFQLSGMLFWSMKNDVSSKNTQIFILNYIGNHVFSLGKGFFQFSESSRGAMRTTTYHKKWMKLYEAIIEFLWLQCLKNHTLHTFY